MSGNLIQLRDGRMAVRSAYDPAKLPGIKALPGARWDRDLRVWTVSSRPEDLADLIGRVTALGYGVEPVILEKARAQAAQEAAQLAKGRASDPRLYPFQARGVAWLQGRQKGLLSDQMGLGKTVQLLMALPDNAAVLVVCPASLKRNWLREVDSWRPDLRPVVLSGRGSFRWPQAGEVVIINYDILPEKVPAGTPSGLVLIADECQKVKSKDATRTKRWKRLVKAADAVQGRVWLSTGTPLMNRPLELWEVLDGAGLAEEAFERFPRFYWLFQAKKTEYGTDWGLPRPQVPQLLRRVSLRRERTEVLPELPEKTYRRLAVNDVDLSKQDQEVLAAAAKAWEQSGDPEELPDFRDMSAAREALARAKVPALLDLVETYEESEEPVVVFSDHLAPVQACGAREGWAVVCGETSQKARQEAVDAFQAGRLRGLALTITAGGEGLTLTRASTMIFADLNWTPAANLQAEDRICRIDPLHQERRAVEYITLVLDHALDQRVETLLRRKQKLIAQTVQQSVIGDHGNGLEDVLAAAKAMEPPRPVQDVEKAPCPACGQPREVRVAGPTSKRPGKKYLRCGCADVFHWLDSTINPEARAWALQAVQALAGVCDGARLRDGQGFNGIDTGYGHWLASLPYLGDELVRKAYALLGKYCGQLESFGLWPRPRLEVTDVE